MPLNQPVRKIDLLLYLAITAFLLVIAINWNAQKNAAHSLRTLDELQRLVKQQTAVLDASAVWMRAGRDWPESKLSLGGQGSPQSAVDVSPYPQ